MSETNKQNTDKPETTVEAADVPCSDSKEAESSENTLPATERKQRKKDPGSGAPKGNMNSVKHGLTTYRIAVLGSMPKSMKYIQHKINKMRVNLEQQVLALKGVISLSDQASINTACRWERHSCLAQRWLRLVGDDLKPADRLNFSREIAKGSAERDKSLAALDLDRAPAAPWEIEATVEGTADD